MKTLINVEPKVQPTTQNVIKNIERAFSSIHSDIPKSLKELDEIVEAKKVYLLEELDINLTKKKQKTARNLMLKLFWDIKGGHQQIQGQWHNAVDKMIKDLEESKKHPKEIILCKDLNEDLLLRLKDNSNLDISFDKRGFNNPDELSLCVDDLSISDDFEEMNLEFERFISETYFATEMVVNSGEFSCGSSDGFGNCEDDINWIQDYHKIQFIGNRHSDGYYALSSDSNTIVVVKIVRMSDELIDETIESLHEVKKRF